MTAITVTAAHIAQGEPGSCTDCPVALAIEEALPEVEAWVGGAFVFLTPGNGLPEEAEELDLPAWVTELILSFDDGYAIEPFTFTLDYPAGAS